MLQIIFKMKSQILLITVSLIYSVFCFSVGEKPLVKIHQGILQGTIVVTKNRRYISAFEGIPYAQPPIGKLRFSSPLPAQPWDGVYLANKQPNICPQVIQEKNIVGDEDCLYLNVFTPILNYKSTRINGTLKSNLLPVMVWVHGGAFNHGSTRIYGPSYLLDKDIILVSMQYRLGIFGFLSTGDEVAPGNFALKDQVLALKWVQKNIQAFGGDPKKVTLFGESAGGASVNFHALSDASNGLFHQYIIQSGIAASPWSYRKRSEYKPFVNKVAKHVRCSIVNSTVLIKCLQETSVKKLLQSEILNNPLFPVLLWTATDELESKDAFLTDSPQNLVAKNKMKDYPFMSGTVSDDGLVATLSFYEPSLYSFETIKNYLEMSINNISKYYLAEDLSKIKTLIEDYYFSKSISSGNKNELLADYTKFVSDSGFFYPELLLVEKMAKVAKSPSYFYSFAYKGNMTMYSEDYKNQVKGVPHAAELYFLFPRTYPKPLSKKDEYVIDVMVDLWTSFAINGYKYTFFLTRR